MKHKKYKVCVDARMINASGIGIVIKNLLPKVIENFTVLLIGNKNELSLYKENLNVEIIHTTASIYSIKILMQYPFFKKADLLWVPHFNVPILSNSKKMVVTIHDVYHLDYISKLSFSEKAFAKLFYYLACKKSTHIFTVSNFTKNRLVSIYNLKEYKISIAKLGARKIIASKTLEHDNNFKDYFLYVGNLKPHKNVKVAIDAYSQLPVEIQNKLHFKIVGKSTGFINADDNLPNLVQKLGLNEEVIFYDYVTDETLSNLYANAKFLVFPSIYEGFGLPILEAFSQKVPVICSNIEVFKEVAGDAAIYFKVNSSHDLKNKILNFYKNSELNNSLIDKGMERLKLYSWESCSQMYINKFISLLKNN